MDNNNLEMVCARCGYVGKNEIFSKGSYSLEILLWLMLFIPGAIYSAWRFFNEYRACPICQNKDMTPLNSSFGKKIMAEKQRMHAPISKKEQLEIMRKLMRFF